MRLPTTRTLFNMTVCLILGGGFLSTYYFVHNGVYQYNSRAGTWPDEGGIDERLRDMLMRGIPLFQNKETAALPYINGSSFDLETDVVDTSFLKVDKSASSSKTVILFSYMRSGSSFIGDALFNMNADVFYAFEPLASLYVAMYGLDVSSVIDTDLIFWPNGTVRKFKEEEVQAITWMLSNLLTCNLTSFPLEMYGHHFWDWSHGLYKYSDCLHEHSIPENVKSCHDYIDPLCGSHFADPTIDSARCFQTLWQPFWRDATNIKGKSPRLTLRRREIGKLRQYRECLSVVKDSISDCVPRLQDRCRQSPIRAAKIVRGSMGTLDKLMQLLPNLHIIHLYRDPRAVVRSRRGIDWSQGHYDGSDVFKLAQTYCKRVSMDTRQRKLMQKRYPNRIMELVYDKLIEDPLPSLLGVFKFLNLEATPEALNFIQFSMQDSRTLKSQWTYELSDREIASIEKACQEFASDTKFDWARFNGPLRVETKILD